MPRIEESDDKRDVERSKAKKKHAKASQLKQTIMGAIAAMSTRFLTQPLDVVKIRLQLQSEPTRLLRSATGGVVQSKYTSIWQSFKVIYREEGRCGFWKGHGAGQLIALSNGLVHFWSFEQCRYVLYKFPVMQRHKNFTNFIAGTVSGCLGTIAGMPFDVVRTRLVAQDISSHITAYGIYSHIIRTEGVLALYRGLYINVIQVCPMMGSNFMVYHFCNNLGKKYLLAEHDRPLPVWYHLVSGSIAGIVSKNLVYPLDFIKKRMQLRDFIKDRQSFGRNLGCENFLECVRVTLKKEGFLAFYKGIIPTSIKSAGTTGLYFTIYDELARRFADL